MNRQIAVTMLLMVFASCWGTNSARERQEQRVAELLASIRSVPHEVGEIVAFGDLQSSDSFKRILSDSQEYFVPAQRLFRSENLTHAERAILVAAMGRLPDDKYILFATEVLDFLARKRVPDENAASILEALVYSETGRKLFPTDKQGSALGAKGPQLDPRMRELITRVRDSKTYPATLRRWASGFLE